MASTIAPAAALLKRAWSVGRGLTVLVVLNVFVLGFSVLGRIVDDTTAYGVSVWDKPAKFALSFLAFGPVLLWLLSRIERSRPIRIGGGVLGWSMVLETSLIFMQSVRGTASHFNNATPFDETVFQLMAAGVGIFATAGLITAFLLARRNLGSDALGLATKIAVPLMTLGATLGFSMTGPREGQVEAGGAKIGGHNVGGADGGAGIPFLGWSTEFGDLRVAHFIGLHSLQFLPLVALAVMRLSQNRTLRLDNTGQRRVTALAAAAYAGLMLTAFVQALRGIPVTRPDTATVAMLALVVLAPGLVAITHALRQPPPAVIAN